MGSSPMEKIGECDGVTLYFADNSFKYPGVYYWDGTDNVRVWPPETPSPPQPSASAGERARELLADACERAGLYEAADGLRANLAGLDVFGTAALRAIESALTNSQAEVEQLRLDLGHTQALLAMRNDEIEALITAAAGGALRELVVRWRDKADECADKATVIAAGKALTYSGCADELEALINAALGRGGRGE